MGREKCALQFGGHDQLSRSVEAMRAVCREVYISLRPDQELAGPLPEGIAGVVRDRYGEEGPLGGILSAFYEFPEHAWLVVAIDLPFAGAAVLKHLVEARDPSRPATVYRSLDEGRPEPMCAIYEPACGPWMLERFRQENMRSPRRLLMSLEVHQIDPPHEWALDNVNTREEYDRAKSKFEKTE
jgi:molybdopterin-guanine dinucleotide biosynthesis protein A